ncbi:MAG: hypothetical protein HQK87_03325, partial [Nitrospinae bacterium]|nr:hypothetical protein [Nitrospinota bacterium]
MSARCPYCGAPVEEPVVPKGETARQNCSACGNQFMTTREVTQVLVTPSPGGATVVQEESAAATAARLYREAGTDLARKNFKLAVARLTAAADLDPTRLDILLALGGASSHANMVYEALAAYRKALELAPDDETALLRSAMLFAQQKSYDEAESRLTRLVTLCPDHPQAVLLRDILRQERAATRKRNADTRAGRPLPPVGVRLAGLFGRLGPADLYGALSWL